MLDTEIAEIILRTDLVLDEKVRFILEAVADELTKTTTTQLGYAMFWRGGSPSLAEDYHNSVESMWRHVLSTNGVIDDELLGGRGRDVSEVGVDRGVEPVAGDAGVVVDPGQDRGSDPESVAENLDTV